MAVQSPPVDTMRSTSTGKVLRVVVIYAVCAVAWIVCSDLLLDVLVENTTTRARIGTFKGWLFVAVTAALLFFVLRAHGRPSADAVATQPDQSEGFRPLVWPLVLVSAIVVALTSASIMLAYRHEQADDASTLEAISDLRLAQISNWLAERRAQAQFASTSALFADLYKRWRDGGDAQSVERLIHRLIDFRTAGGAQAVLVVDESGSVVASESPAQEPHAPELRDAALRALATGKVQMTSIYGGGSPATPLRIDIVAPLLQTGTPARAAIVLRLDPKVFLFPTLDAWPFPTTAGATHLMRREGDVLIGYGNNRVLKVPVTKPSLLAARFVRGEIPYGRAGEGLDFRGIPVLGALRTVPDTDWYLVAKIDRSEILASVAKDAVWIIAGGLLALIAGWFGVYHLRQRQRYNLALLERAAQAEKLRALQLVEAITEGSTDSIFARDLDGRYLLINRAASADLGQSREAILGRTVEPLNANDARVVAENRILTFEEETPRGEGHATHLVTKGPLHDADGKVIGLFGIARDITEQRRAEATLRASEERLRLFVQHAPVAIAMFDRAMNYLAVSQRWFADYALGERDLVGLSHYDVFPQLASHWKGVHERCLTGSVEQSEGDQMARPDGSIDWVRWEMRPWHDESGAIGGALLFSEIITERRRTEAALRESEKRLDLALSAAGMGVWEWNLQTDQVFWSREAMAIASGRATPGASGTYTLQEFIERVLEEDRATLLTGARAAIESHSIFSVEFRFRRLDGEVRWLSNLARGEYDADGKPLRLIGTVHDVTERKRMQAENERAAALVTATLDSTDNGIVVADESGRIVMWNRRLLDLVPNLPEEVLRAGSRAAILEHLIHLFADRDAVRRSGREIDSRPDYTDLSTLALTDGRFIERFTQPMLVEGRVAGRVWSFRDVTARQRAIADAETRSRDLEAKVKQRTEDLQTAIAERTAADEMAMLIANNIPGRIAYWSRELHCVFVNKVYCQFLGTDKSEIVGRSMMEIVGATLFRAVEERVRAVLRGEPQRFEREERAANGHEVNTLIHYIPDRSEDGIRGFFVLASDITDAKRNERHLQELNDELTRARDRADAANRAKSAFLANMSHEIRTPMNAIIGFTHLLQRDVRTPAQLERLGKVDEAAHHLLTIINDILDLSKIESGKLTLEQTDFSLDALLARTCSLIADRARDKGLELVVDTGRVPDLLRGDPTRLSQALLNLLSNAVKFTERGMILCAPM
jgi:PAS domain S-box-containing protein